MAATLRLDKFKLLWLCEGAMGKSHLRWDIYDMMVNDVYPQLNDNEREFIYTYLKRDTAWLWENPNGLDETPHQYWLQTLARYNPANQYVVTLKEGRKKAQTADNAYLWDGKYYVGWQRYCAPEFIKKIERKPYRKCTNDYCAARCECLRFIEHQKGDEVLEGGLCGCDKCDLIIEVEK